MVKAKKLEYGERLVKMIGEYSRILVVGCDNVGSSQMQQIRRSLRGSAEVLMGKNVRGRAPPTLRAPGCARRPDGMPVRRLPPTRRPGRP